MQGARDGGENENRRCRRAGVAAAAASADDARVRSPRWRAARSSYGARAAASGAASPCRSFILTRGQGAAFISAQAPAASISIRGQTLIVPDATVEDGEPMCIPRRSERCKLIEDGEGPDRPVAALPVAILDPSV